MNDDFTTAEKEGFYKAVYSRRDVRSHFTAEPISNNTITKILHAAHHAPSVGFSQPWNFVLIKDNDCLLYTSPSPRDRQKSRMPSSA